MNYLVVTNTGLIEPEDLYLIGSSTKRGDSSKIGMFGSGWKFALAWLMRNDCLPLIYSGENQIEIDFDIVMHRSTPVRVITVNGKQTSLTSEMGPKWTGWMAVREIVSNAIDEGGDKVDTQWNPTAFEGKEGMTTIYIPMNNELSNVLRCYNDYFAFERTASFENEIGKIYFKAQGSSMVIYRKGIRCYDTDKITKTDFNFHEIEINEDRLTQSAYVCTKINRIVSAGVSTSVLKNLLLEDEIRSFLPEEPNQKIIESLTELLDLTEVFTCPSVIGLGGVLIIQNPTLIIPNKWFQKLADMGLIESPFSKMFQRGTAPEDFIRTDAKNILHIKYLLEGLNLNYEYYSGLFKGNVHVFNNQVYINDNHSVDDESIAAQIIYASGTEFFKSQFR